MTIPKLANLKRLHIAVAGLLLTTILALGPTMQASAFTDGVSWTECDGRYTVGSVTFSTGKVTAYGCSVNHYFFVTTTANTKANSIIASITRTVKYGRQELKSSSNVYSLTTNMLYQVNGACYNVWGSVNGTGKGWTFCW